VRHAAHAAAASAPPQPRLPDHLGAPSGGHEAPLGQAADDLTFNSTIKDRLAGTRRMPVHSGHKVIQLMLLQGSCRSTPSRGCSSCCQWLIFRWQHKRHTCTSWHRGKVAPGAGPEFLKRAGSAEAESPPNARLYAARLRSAAPAAQPSNAHNSAWPQPRLLPPGRAVGNPKRAAVPSFQREASDPPLPSGQGNSGFGAPSVDAASEGPIKKRFKVMAAHDAW
jgi:hypothetical protein